MQVSAAATTCSTRGLLLQLFTVCTRCSMAIQSSSCAGSTAYSCIVIKLMLNAHYCAKLSHIAHSVYARSSTHLAGSFPSPRSSLSHSYTPHLGTQCGSESRCRCTPCQAGCQCHIQSSRCPRWARRCTLRASIQQTVSTLSVLRV
jgi:hypothetical protein